MKVQVEFFDVDLFIMMCHCRFKIEKIEKKNKTKQKHKAEAVRCLGLYRCFQFSIFSIATFT